MLRTELIRPVPELLRTHADGFGGKVAFDDGRRRVSYAELELRTRRLAGHLAELPLRRGDRVAIYLPNCVEVVESYLAITRAGAIGVPLNPQSADAELAYLLEDSGARVVISDPAHLGQLSRLLPRCPGLRVVVTGAAVLPADAPPGSVSFAVLTSTDPATPARDDLGLDDHAWMLYTSGTTGRPKGVLSTQRGCLWAVAAAYAPILGLSAEHRVLWPLPLFHSVGHILCVLGVTATGASARIMPGFSAAEALELLEKEEITFLAGVPTVYHHLLRAARRTEFTAPGLRTCFTVGAACSASLRASFEETFGVSLLDGYGTTETSGLITVNWPTGARVEGSCGLPVPGMSVRLVDPETGNDVDEGHEGEVWVRGPSLMAGYHDQPEATAAAMPGGWYRTGDLARRDGFGYLTITGRLKELIICGGQNIHPGEVEQVLLRVPGVADAAAAGKPHDVLGEVVVAFVVPDSGGGPAPEALFASCREQLSSYKVPTELYEIAAIPRTASGKVTRHVLLDRPARLRAVGGSHFESLFRVDWTPLPAVRPVPGDWAAVGADAAELLGSDAPAYPDLPALRAAVAAGAPAPQVALAYYRPGAPSPDGVAEAEELAAWAADGRLADSRLVVVTRGALSTGPDEDVSDLPHAGLARTAQAEHPGRFVIVDIDTEDGAAGLLGAIGDGEPRLAVRSGALLAPRLARVPGSAGRRPEPPADPNRTVVITGAAGSPGARIARHLVAAHGARHLLLISPEGPADEDAARLTAELRGAGAKVRLAACDTADRAALAAVLGAVSPPIGAVVHLDTEPFPSTADSALNLHELTEDRELSAFVLCSSAAEADAGRRAFLDALAQHRRVRGLPAVSVAWGPWEGQHTSDPRPLTLREGLVAFDAATTVDEPALVAMRLDAAAGDAVVDGPADEPARPDENAAAALRQRLAGLPETERARRLTGLVRAEAAEACGLREEDVRAEHSFRELGLTSMTAVVLRDRLSAATGLMLSTTVAFDHPTLEALAGHLRAELLGERPVSAEAVPARVAADEDLVAIIGMGGRYPGGVGSPDDLWRLVAGEVDAIGEFPADRGWDLEGLYDPDPDHAGKSYTRHGGFLYDAAEFDADFFGISPREALAMDPQQRLLLETSWEALEHAGIDPLSLRSSQTGVFTGVMLHDYASRLDKAPEDMEAYLGLGSAASVASGRIAYTFGFEGPAVSVDTACSSSLVALHWAVRSLRQGECSLALAGGVAVMASPTSFVEFSRRRGLSPDGRCKAFAAAADGSGWAEGAGVVLLERLSDARRLGHPVLAVIRGSAVNQDGASNGLPAPNGPSQQRVIRQALADAGLSAADVDAVEAHGTGTALGDPVEAQAIVETYGQDREVPLWLGSMKSNIGHSQAAAGVGGVLKMVMAMRHGVLPKTLHVDRPSPRVDWSAGAVRLLTETRTWPETGRPRRVAVSSFGISGTNAHVILEAASPDESPDVEYGDIPMVPLPLSARTPEALRAQAHRLRDHLDGHARTADVGFSLATTRAGLPHRAVVVGATRDELLRGLDVLAGGTTGGGVVTGTARASAKVAFLFTGQGAQRCGMGRDLHASYPAFAEAFDAVCAEFDGSLRDVVWGDDAGLLSQTDWAQAGLFAVEVALFRLFEHWGVRPDFLAGHSIGEIAAAHVAGVLSLRDAATMVSARGRLMRALPPGGAMVAIHASEDEVLPLLPDAVSIAAVNGPESVVVSGDGAPAVGEHFAALGRKTSRLPVSHAFHSPLMEPMLAEFAEVVRGLSFVEPAIPVVSNVTGKLADSLTDPEYWVRHIREAVRFADGISTLENHGVTTFLELGPDAVLTALAAQTLTSGTAVLAPALRRSRPEAAVLVEALGSLHVSGVAVDWAKVFGPARRVPLPTYAFQHQRYWLDAPASAGDATGFGQLAVDHPLLGAAVELPDTDGLALTGRLSLAGLPWLADHAVLGTVLLPGTAFVELAAHAGGHLGAGHLTELTVEAPLALPYSGAVAIQLVVGGADESGRREFSVHSRAEGGSWTRHATGSLDDTGPVRPGFELSAWPPPGAEPIPVSGLYADLAAAGLDYGPVFQGVRAAWRLGEEIHAEIELPESQRDDAGAYGLHPALLDAALHGIGLGPFVQGGGTLLPFSWRGVSLHATGASALRVRLSPAGENAVAIAVADGTGAPVASVESLVLRPVSADQLRGASADSLFRLDWVPLQVTEDGAAAEFVELRFPPVEFSVQAAHAATRRALEALRSWDGGSPLVFVTRGAIGDDVTDLVHAPLWGLVRSAQSENPGRFVLVDVDDTAEPAGLVAKAVATGEPQLLIRNGVVHGGRLVRATTGDALTPPPSAPAWRLGTTGRGTLALLPCPEVLDPLAAGRIRVEVRAAGVDSRDALIGLGRHPDPDASLGGKAAGVVTEVGAGVTDLAVGDRVLGLFDGSVGPVAVTDRRLVTAIPREWSYATAAAFLTATDTGPDRPADLMALFERGALRPPPVRAWDVRRAPEAFRFLGGAEHVGQIVLTMPRALDPYGTVLVTGATGTIGSLVAKHLVRRHGVRDLVLLSRRGPDAPGAAELLAALDGRARVVACDAADRAALAEVIATIPNLTAVVHAAGVLDDGLIGSLTPERLEYVMAPKVDAAWNLHELTKDLDLAEFTVFSSASATLGSAGQGNYAAANTFLDALAQRRAALGLSGTSLAWGLWAERSELTAEADFARMRRSGVTGLSEQDGLALFDAGRAAGDTVLVPIKLDVAAARGDGDGEVPALLRALVRTPARRAAGTAAGAADTLRRRLAGLPHPERAEALTDLVRTHVATVLGHNGPAAVDPAREFTALGFDSLASVELRNRLATATGLRLPSTLVFDHPTPAGLAEYVGGELAPVPADGEVRTGDALS